MLFVGGSNPLELSAAQRLRPTNCLSRLSCSSRLSCLNRSSRLSCLSCLNGLNGLTGLRVHAFKQPGLHQQHIQNQCGQAPCHINQHVGEER